MRSVRAVVPVLESEAAMETKAQSSKRGSTRPPINIGNPDERLRALEIRVEFADGITRTLTVNRLITKTTN